MVDINQEYIIEEENRIIYFNELRRLTYDVETRIEELEDSFFW